MRRGLCGAGLLLGFALCPGVARAEVFHDSTALEPGNFSLGFEGEVAIDGKNGHIGHPDMPISASASSRTPTSDSRSASSIRSPPTSRDIQWALLPNGEGYPGLSVNAGGHWRARQKPAKDYGGIDGTLTISEDVMEQVVFADTTSTTTSSRSSTGLCQPAHLPRNAIRRLRASVVLRRGRSGIKSRADDPVFHYLSGGPTLYF